MTPALAEAVRNIRSVVENRPKIFLWGTFDILHEGHLRSLEAATKLGDLFIIVLPDRVIKKDKDIIFDQDIRRSNLLSTGYAKDVYIDCLPNLICLDENNPDIFGFGYDQDNEWKDKLTKYISDKFPHCKFINFDKYSDLHSSDLRRTIKCPCGSGKEYQECCGENN